MANPIRRRMAHVLWSTTAIVALGWWSWYSNPDPSLPEIMANPIRFDGREVKIGDEPIIESIDDNSFVIRSRGFRIRVSAQLSPDDIGRFAYVRGTFNRAEATEDCDGFIQPSRHYVARGRHAKIWISVIPTLWIATLLLRHFRLNTTRWCIKPQA